MKVSLSVEFTGSFVAVLGGGHVALRKTRRFLEAGAEVYICSLSYLAEFNDLPVNRVTYEQLVSLLPRMRLAIACTDDREANMHFVRLAEEKGILAMCAQKECGQNTFSMAETVSGKITIAASSDAAFPLAAKHFLEHASERLTLLEDIRRRLADRSLSRMLDHAEMPQLMLIKEAAEKKKALVFLMHGSSGALAAEEASALADKAQKRFSGRACGWLYTGRKHMTLSLQELCTLFQDLKTECTFSLLFWEDGTYAHEARMTAQAYGYSCIHPELDPHQLLEKGENPVLHTRESADADSVLVSLLYSPFLRSQYPDLRYRIYLEDPRSIETILACCEKEAQ